MVDMEKGKGLCRVEKLRELLRNLKEQQSLTDAILSNVRRKEDNHYHKVTIKPLLLKNQLIYQISYYYNQKVSHENISEEKWVEKMISLFEHDFKQGLLHTKEADYQVLISKKHKVSILKKKATKVNQELAHNRQKNYLLKEGTPVPFLIELGVMNKEGKVFAKKYDKFKQINRFLEMVDDIVPFLRKDRKLTIIDFGCGKSYLTFALYHYLTELQKLDIQIVGLDLKEDVINHCNELCKKLEYEGLRFHVGDIGQYQDVQEVDMVVTLHACDTATDAALEKAVRWGADVILSVPCCQHEMFTQLKNTILSPMLDHGILKERFSALATDGVRAQILEMTGYKAQLLEFIDLEHTPKNLLIRAVKQSQSGDLKQTVTSYLEFKQFLHIDPYLENALADQLKPLFEEYTV
jgi:SAM-dependent methyltransferase